MAAVIISDLHLGSPHFKPERLYALLQRIPDGNELILNGDTIDSPTQPLPPEHHDALKTLISAAQRLSITWLRGNHDAEFTGELGAITVKDSHAIGHRLYITHGHNFDVVMPAQWLFIRVFRLFHRLRIACGATPIHVAEYAKKWALLYRHLRQRVQISAISFAQQNGYAAVTCGHVHYAEDKWMHGVRYINSGAWTETVTHCILVDDDQIKLCSDPDRYDGSDIFSLLTPRP